MSALALVLASSLSWAAGNLVVKRMARFGPVAPLALVGWGNVPSLLAFALSALALHGPQGVWRQVSGLNAAGWISVLYLAWIAGLLGYAGWSALLARHPAGRVTPLALLAPAIALVTAALLLHVFGPPLAQRLARVWARGRA
ncbi:MAG: EamA family transporter [Ottowia sp.]